MNLLSVILMLLPFVWCNDMIDWIVDTVSQGFPDAAIECYICEDSADVYLKTQCNHISCKRCLDKWTSQTQIKEENGALHMTVKNDCPMCRKEISDTDTTVLTRALLEYVSTIQCQKEELSVILNRDLVGYTVDYSINEYEFLFQPLIESVAFKLMVAQIDHEDQKHYFRQLVGGLRSYYDQLLSITDGSSEVPMVEVQDKQTGLVLYSYSAEEAFTLLIQLTKHLEAIQVW